MDYILYGLCATSIVFGLIGIIDPFGWWRAAKPEIKEEVTATKSMIDFDASAFRTEFVNELSKTKTYDEGRSLFAKYKQILGHEHPRIQNFMYLRVETREYDSY